jgi:lipopolysaccharide transport system permease protein
MYLSAVNPMALCQKMQPWLVHYNPLAYVIEAGRYMLLNVGQISGEGLTYCSNSSCFLWIVDFNKTGRVL